MTSSGYLKKKQQAANKKIMAKEIKKKDCFFQKRKVEGRWLDPILLEVVGIIENCEGYRGIYQVRWHTLGKDKVYTSKFPMATFRDGEFADFHPMPRKVLLECVKILKDVENYKNVKRRVVYRMKKFLADTE